MSQKIMQYETNLEAPLVELLDDKKNQEKHEFDAEYFSIYRNGGCEIDFCFQRRKDKTIQPSPYITVGPGIYFENQESMDRYANDYFKMITHFSLLGIWTMYETKERMKIYEENNAKVINATGELIEPYFFFHKEVQLLREIMKGKRILIVSSHEKSIQHQIPKVDEIFAPFKIFEDCTFITIKPPVTTGGNHENKDWTDHLQLFFDKLDPLQNDFDIALIAAGGYGFHITDYIYTTLKKSSIYVGGPLQLYFGIMGKRWKPWFTKERFTYFPNDSWLDSPFQEDIPQNSNLVEGSCYW